MATIQIEEKIEKNLKKASKLMGVKKNELVNRAFLYYFESIRDLLNLEREIEAWNALSDEAAQRMRMRSSPRT